MGEEEGEVRGGGWRRGGTWRVEKQEIPFLPSLVFSEAALPFSLTYVRFPRAALCVCPRLLEVYGQAVFYWHTFPRMPHFLVFLKVFVNLSVFLVSMSLVVFLVYFFSFIYLYSFFFFTAYLVSINGSDVLFIVTLSTYLVFFSFLGGLY